ncbi:hypothetical protein [Kaistella jeonii]|uniref:Uncharacterized protein n=1 Tax=Kaistella jeonii TaxID=266749 RepID=A0A0C1D8I6_9FLAO|nr:hypothetical protein [Kaistella jeonii]KIA90160.1 hypothetical protein OA86_06125 [Kaistella jeonii]SFB76909.1 hypothetical protein SAMN05421876_10257 [Kaistella jeonii]VEI96448.1 Uncharacterised protein [Kaistella jeonii]
MIDILLNLFSKITFGDLLQFIKYILPILLSIWAVFYIRRSSFYYIERSNIKLYDDVIKKINGISIKYKNSNINENLILFNGTIIFKGHNDVKSDDIDKQLTIYSKDIKAVWKHFEITKTSVDFQPKFIIDKNKIIIEKSLLKSNDFISFAGLLDSKNTKLTVGHRIYNIIPSSINFKENDLSLYKLAASFLTLFFIFIAAVSAYSKYKFAKEIEETKFEIKPVANKIKISKKDSILYRSFDFKTEFYIENNRVQIDTLAKQFGLKLKNKTDKIEKANEREFNSLTEIYRKDRSDKNEIILLKKFIDNFSFTFKKIDNPYTKVKEEADKKLIKLISDNKLENKKFYKLNDSLGIKYFDKNLPASEIIKTKENSADQQGYLDIAFSIIEYVFTLFLLIISSILWYKYIRLLKLKKRYSNI